MPTSTPRKTAPPPPGGMITAAAGGRRGEEGVRPRGLRLRLVFFFFLGFWFRFDLIRMPGPTGQVAVTTTAPLKRKIV